VIPIGVKLPESRSRDFDVRTPLRIVYSGLLNRFQKRIFDVVAIARELDRRGVAFRLTFCGGGEDEGDLRMATDDLVSRDVVRFTGILDHQSLSAELSRNDVVIMTSEFEGLPNALLEAMAHGLVPIVSRIESGIPEVVRDDWNGYTVAVGDTPGFADRLCDLDQDRDRLAIMATRSHDTIASGPYNLEHMVDSYVGLIQHVAEETTNGAFNRRRGSVRPPDDVGPMWRQYIPHWLRMSWRWLRKVPRSVPT
jgi:glycosyltransferase involved in cell wall biosynthesis